MQEDKLRKKVQAALKKAEAESHVVFADFARDIGWSRQSLSAFKKSGHGDFAKVKALAALLHAKGLLEDIEPATEAVTAEIHLDECQACGSIVPVYHDGKRLIFCGACGEPLGIVCGYCGTLNERHRVTCISCNWPLTEEAVRNKVAQDAALYKFNDTRRHRNPEEVITSWREQQRAARDSRKFKLPPKEGEPNDHGEPFTR